MRDFECLLGARLLINVLTDNSFWKPFVKVQSDCLLHYVFLVVPRARVCIEGRDFQWWVGFEEPQKNEGCFVHAGFSYEIPSEQFLPV